MVSQLEQQLARQRTNLAHLDATMQLFDPVIRLLEIRPKQPRARIALFRRGACLRLIYDGLRNAPEPLTQTGSGGADHACQAYTGGDDSRCKPIRKTAFGSLNRRRS